MIKRSKNIAVIVVNDQQRRLILMLEKLHLIKIEGSDNVSLILSGRVICTFCYISGWSIIVSKVVKLFNSGFLVSDDGIDYRNYEYIVNFLNEELAKRDQNNVALEM